MSLVHHETAGHCHKEMNLDLTPNSLPILRFVSQWTTVWATFVRTPMALVCSSFVYTHVCTYACARMCANTQCGTSSHWYTSVWRTTNFICLFIKIAIKHPALGVTNCIRDWLFEKGPFQWWHPTCGMLFQLTLTAAFLMAGEDLYYPSRL